MTDKTLKRANEINKSLAYIRDAKQIMNENNPWFCLYGMFGSISSVCFSYFDEETANELKNTILNILSSRENALQKEMDEL